MNLCQICLFAKVLGVATFFVLQVSVNVLFSIFCTENKLVMHNWGYGMISLVDIK